MARNGGWRESGRNVLFAMALAAGMILAGGHPSAWADDGPGSDTKSRPQPTAQHARTSGATADAAGPARRQRPGPRKTTAATTGDSTESSATEPTPERRVAGPAARDVDPSALEAKPSSGPGTFVTLRPPRLRELRTNLRELRAKSKDLAQLEAGPTGSTPSGTDATVVAAGAEPGPSVARVVTNLLVAVGRPEAETPQSHSRSLPDGSLPTAADTTARRLNAPTGLRALHVVPDLTDAVVPDLREIAAPTVRLAGARADKAVADIGTALSAPPAIATVTSRAVDTDIPVVQPLSPLVKLAQAPAQLINKVLQVLDFTVSEKGPRPLLDWNPISQALFAGFRKIEDVLGLDKQPADVPEMTQVDYTCADHGTCAAKTPTVQQFLNAASAKYVLGGQPGGDTGDLKPFVVDGHQMTSTNTLSGMSGTAWVTPEGQVIIAYSGTTGGTNLLANPVIAVTQIIADLQVIATPTTPWAFHDALDFADEVRAEAHNQGYSDDDIFVTGHSLGGWEAQYVAQHTGLGGIGFEGPGLNTVNPGNNNGADSNFVNVLTYGDAAAYFSSDVPGLDPIMRLFPGGTTKPHYGNIVMIGDPEAANPMINAAALMNTSPLFLPVVVVDVLVNFFQYHLPGVQAHHLGVSPDPGVVPWLGNVSGRVDGWGDLTIPQLQQAASAQGRLMDNGVADRPAADSSLLAA